MRLTIKKAAHFFSLFLTISSLFFSCNLSRTAASDGVSNSDLAAALNDVCRYGTQEQVNDALVKGANVNSFHEGFTPLMAAAQRGSVPIVRILLSHGAWVNASTSGGARPLYYAVLSHSLPVAALLISHGADINAGDNSRSTPLMFAAANSPKMLDFLLTHGAKVSLKDRNGQPALVFAAMSNAYCVALLIKHRAAVNERYAGGETPLLDAAQMENYKAVRILLEHGAEVDAQNNLGKTALMLASYQHDMWADERPSQRQRRLTLLLLKQFGAREWIRDKAGKTAAKYAHEEADLLTAS